MIAKIPTNKVSDHEYGDEPTILTIRIARLEVDGDRRTHKEGAINDMAASMREVGLVNPITISPRGKDKNGKATYDLGDGLLRLKGAAQLGWTKITAIVLKGDKDQIRLANIAANLFHEGITALERALLINEWHEIVGRKAAHGAHPGGKQPNDKGNSKAAKALNLSRRMIERSIAIASLSADAIDAAKAAGLANSQKDLLAVAAAQPDKQVEKAKEIGRRRKPDRRTPKKEETQNTESPNLVPENAPNADTPDEARDIDAPDEAFDALQSAWEESPDFVAAWNKAPLPTRERFIKQVLRQSADTGSENANKGVANE